MIDLFLFMMVIYRPCFLRQIKKGCKMNTHNIEFWFLLDKLVQSSKIVIDRPKNTVHPKFKEMLYPLDYGYLAGTVSTDKGGIDIWVGSDSEQRVSAIVTTVDMAKRDSEIKILYACTQEEIKLVYEIHNRYDGMKGILNIR